MRRYLHYIIVAIIVCSFTAVSAQSDSYRQEIQQFREARDAMFAVPEKSPLTAEQITAFDGLQFFPIEEKYSVKAILNALESEDTEHLKMSAGGSEKFQQYGTINFQLDGKDYSMEVYRKGNLKDLSDQKGELFLPFMDASSGNETSALGRYVSVSLPAEGNEVIVDFNKAINPFAAYNSENNSPLAPDVNTIDISLLAGERKYEDR